MIMAVIWVGGHISLSMPSSILYSLG